jgi:ribosomal protein S18 acetylase RimI-like enzyme
MPAAIGSITSAVSSRARYNARMASPLRFRRAQASDIPALLALVHRAYRGEASRAGWTTEADLLDGQRTNAGELHALSAGAEGTRIILGSTDDVPVASMLFAPEIAHVYLGMIAVCPARQAEGLGRQLLAEAERITRHERLPPRLRLSVIAQRDELIAWYVRRGFRPTGERAPFPYGEPSFGLPRRPDLYFVIFEKAI